VTKDQALSLARNPCFSRRNRIFNSYLRNEREAK